MASSRCEKNATLFLDGIHFTLMSNEPGELEHARRMEIVAECAEVYHRAVRCVVWM